MKFKTNIDWPFYLIAALSSISLFIIIIEWIVDKHIMLIPLFTAIGIAVYIWPLLLNTTYHLLANELVIYCGFRKVIIPFECIVTVKKTQTKGAAYGLSIQRVAIQYMVSSGDKTTLISPQNRDDFIRQLNSKCTYLTSK